MAQPAGLRVLLLALLSFVNLVAASTAWTADAYPNPLVDLTKCGRNNKPSFICDPDGVLESNSADFVDGIVKDIKEGNQPYTKAACGFTSQGYHVAVALVRKMVVPSYRTPDDQAQYFAEQIHNKWGVGDAACHNGVLLFLSVDDRKVYLSVGSSVHQILTVSRIDTIISRMRPALRAQNYNEAVEGAVIDVGLFLSGGQLNPPHDDSGGGGDTILVVIFASIIGLFSFNACRRQRRQHTEQRRCRDLLEKLKREAELAHQNQAYPNQSCPICLEDFDLPAAAAPAVKVKAENPLGKDAAGSSVSVQPSAPCVSLLDDESSTTLLQGEAARASTPSSVRREVKPLQLPCNHVFCETCISRWLDQHSSCPICRRNLADPDGNDAANAAPASSSQLARPAGFNQAVYADELSFRMGSLQRRYPHIVTRHVLSDWSSAISHGRGYDLESVRSWQLRDPDVRAAHAAQGRGHAGGGWAGGGHASFGGGGSLSGGGRGGGW